MKIKGGNSNWRGPIWFPTSYLLIESLMKFGEAHGPEFQVAHAGERRRCRSRPHEMAREIADRMIGLFTRGEDGTPPHLRRNDERSSRIRTGATACSSTSTSTATTAPGSAPTTRPGWTGLVANLIDDGGPYSCLWIATSRNIDPDGQDRARARSLGWHVTPRAF